MSDRAPTGKKYAPHECGALVLGQTLGERSTLLIAMPNPRHVDLCQNRLRSVRLLLLALAIAWASAACDTWGVKASGSENKVDWGVSARF